MKNSSNEPYLVEIGKPGKFDPVFGLLKYDHDFVLELWVIVYKDTGIQVPKSGGFLDPIQAESWLKQNRERIIQESIEDIVL